MKEKNLIFALFPPLMYAYVCMANANANASFLFLFKKTLLSYHLTISPSHQPAPTFPRSKQQKQQKHKKTNALPLPRPIKNQLPP